ncbi:hypothetical protein RPMA_14775 [Tardiphaga alba]|uniref:Secreted protein with PEP-CTERM sorting signal n=1 Tax=Tardiphaga alba TaxID=340268 RepID=A0ABX8A887_9BRAD|nr:hypothetical protein [Tardiphaga alba]QUS39953.1 hypothetical protein RPMA_14775 [Tardiphaga alba]
MRFLGSLLVVIGTLWIIMCFLGTSMMSRSVDMFTEAVLPSAVGFAAILLGVWVFNRRRAKGELPPSLVRPE